MKVVKILTVAVLSVQLGLVGNASADNIQDLSLSYPHIRACYQVDAEALKATAPRLSDLGRTSAFKEFSGILKVLENDFERRSHDTDYNTRWWFTVSQHLNHEQLSQADNEFEKNCKSKVIEKEREYLKVGMSQFSFVNESENQKLLNSILEELTQQIEKNFAHKAE